MINIFSGDKNSRAVININGNGQIVTASGNSVVTVVDGEVKNVSGKGSVTIVNGEVKNISETNDKIERIDKRKSYDAKNIEKITIDSVAANINVLASNSLECEAHLHGFVDANVSIDLDVSITNQELKIAPIIKANSYTNNLKLDVIVPQKKLNEISVKTLSGCIRLEERVLTDYLRVESISGDLVTNATFSNAFASTRSGDIELYIDAKEDIHMNLSTMSGWVSTELNNIGNMNIIAETMSGKVRNYHKCQTGHNANVNISSMSGNIIIK